MLTRLFGRQGTINVLCCSPDGQTLALVSYLQLSEESLNPESRRPNDQANFSAASAHTMASVAQAMS